MLNHARTLLLNRDSDKSPGFAYPGEQAVPTVFNAINLPTYLDTIRSRLFGATPDRAMLNYRLWQLMGLLHATPELEDFVLALDPRVTYVDSVRTDLFDEATFEPTIIQITGATAPLYKQGSGDSPDASGQTFHKYDIDILTSTTVEVLQRTAPVSQVVENFALSGGVSNAISLGNSGYGFILSTDSVNVSYGFEVFNRPTWELGDIAVSLESIGEPTLIQLFGTQRVEPYATFKNMWEQSDELPFKLGGLLLAVIYRTDEERRAVNG